MSRRGELSDSNARPNAAARALRHIAPIALAVITALALRTMVFETYYVPSESMLPTLLIGDHMIVDKFSFGARIPFSDDHLPALREPGRGEVVIFVLGRTEAGAYCPLDRCPATTREGFVKRIIGLPGDEIEVRGGRVLINGEELRTEPVDGSVTDAAGEEHDLYIEFIGSAGHSVLDHPARPGMDQVRITVPEGRYFVMGDNRDNSGDSRSWGTLRRDDIIGKVMVLYWSWNNRGSWASMLNPATWWRLLTTETRWHRFGTTVR